MPLDPRDYKLDLSTGAKPHSAGDPPVPSRPFIGVRFACCDVYTRVYRSDDGTQYLGRCPRCGKAVRFAVGPGGTDARTFVVE